MDELVKQITLLSKEEKQVLLKILQEEVEFPVDEKRIDTEAIEMWDEILKREEDIESGRACLITFDDHLLNTKLLTT